MTEQTMTEDQSMTEDQFRDHLATLLRKLVADALQTAITECSKTSFADAWQIVQTVAEAIIAESGQAHERELES